MAAIASTDVTYTIDNADVKYDRLGFQGLVTIAFGDGALTYPSGGVDLLKGKLGGVNEILSLEVIDSSATGYVFEWDRSAQKLRLLYVPDLDGDAADAQPLDELATDETPAAMTLVCKFIAR